MGGNERHEVRGEGSNIDVEVQRLSREQSLDEHDNKLIYVIYGATLIKGIKASLLLLCPILFSVITNMYLKVRTMRMLDLFCLEMGTARIR